MRELQEMFKYETSKKKKKKREGAKN